MDIFEMDAGCLGIGTMSEADPRIGLLWFEGGEDGLKSDPKPLNRTIQLYGIGGDVCPS
mgnify:FL=1